MSSFDPRALTRRTPMPSRGEPSGAVLVALDGTTAGRQALEWAAAEAAARDSALHILRPVSSPLFATSAWLWMYQPDNAESVYSAAHHELELAIEQVHEIVPHLDVSAVLVPGTLGPTSLGDPAHDALLVVGRRRGTARALGTASSGAGIALSRTGMPVAVAGLAERGAAVGPSAGRVILALGTTGDPSPVIGAAFRAAMRRGVGLTLLYAWGRGVIGDVVDEVLAPYEATFPEVSVRTRMVTSLPRAVADESQGAAVTVAATPASAWDVAGRMRAGRLVRAARGPVVLVPLPRPLKDAR